MIMQGQRPSGNPPLRLPWFARKPFRAKYMRVRFILAFRVKYVRVRTTHVGNRTFNARAPWQLAGKYPGNGRFFNRFLVNYSNFFVIFMPNMLPKNMSPINI